MEPPISFIIGLGNPEDKYCHTPHNIGREFVEWLADQEQLKWHSHKHFDIAEHSPSFVRLKAYMNLSGEAVFELLKKFSCESQKILIVTDDFDLPLGTIRVRKKGSAGTHNGLKSIIQHLQTEEFPRLRLGVGPLPLGKDPARFVLDRYSKEAQAMIGPVFERARGAVEAAFDRGVEAAMNEFNAKPNDLS